MRSPFSALVALALSLGLSLTAGPGEAGKPKGGKPRFTNRLAKETSPYLLMHAHNPVDWYPWGPEAFAKAKKENKLIFLSIGYSSCYWCHVMERECFANEEVAKILNKDFVAIKVDREERPDVDQIYMTALQSFRRGGGWPLSMFLTPNGKPVYGGTYWPREDRMEDGEKIPGFKTILQTAHELWTTKREGLLKQADAVAELTVRNLNAGMLGRAIVDLDRTLAEGAVEVLKERFDPEYGGFGSPEAKFRGTKFPTPPYLEYLLRLAARKKSADLLKMVTVTLDHMARGGIYDQLGGGFHRYSTERTWTVPHFEKMLYDNAQLAEVYAHAYAQTKDPLYRRILDETLEYVRREMTSPEGGFYSSQDAETHHEEGRFYVWTDQEIDDVLRDKTQSIPFRGLYGAKKGKFNFEGKYHILTLPKWLPEYVKSLKTTEAQLLKEMQPLRQKMLEARSRRDRPLRNEVMLTAWSGQMIGGLAEAGRVLGEKNYVEAAARAAAFVLKHQRTPDGRLLRTYGAQPGKAARAAGPGYLEDYAFLVHGLLNLYDATKDKKWLAEARALTETMSKQFADEKGGGYYFTAHDHEKLFARSKDQYDGAQPSGNSMAVYNLVRLWQATGEERYRAEAEKDFKAFAGALKAYPQTLTTMLQALDLYLDVKEAKAKKQGAARTAGAVRLAGMASGVENENVPGPGRNRIFPVSDRSAADIERERPPTEGYRPPPLKERASQTMRGITVKVLAADPDRARKRVFIVVLNLDEGRYLYANPVGLIELEPLQLRLQVVAGGEPWPATVVYPPGVRVEDSVLGAYRIYEGAVSLKVTLDQPPPRGALLEVHLRGGGFVGRNRVMFA